MVPLTEAILAAQRHDPTAARLLDVAEATLSLAWGSGIRYFDSYDIPALSFDGLVGRDPSEKAQTTALLRERMSEPYKVRQWSGLFSELARLQSFR